MKRNKSEVNSRRSVLEDQIPLIFCSFVMIALLLACSVGLLLGIGLNTRNLGWLAWSINGLMAGAGLVTIIMTVHQTYCYLDRSGSLRTAGVWFGRLIICGVIAETVALFMALNPL